MSLGAERIVRMVDFEQAVKDCTGGQQKVKKRDYLPKGEIPIIDQGQSLIAGFTDDSESVYSGDLPVILFGDHTLIFKYVDFPFALGADGVKALSIHKGFEPKYLYYFWQSCRISSRGYSRHFKFLREIRLPLIPLSEQKRIVEILDQADALRKKRAEADTKAARILPSFFYKMFGDPATNSKVWATVYIKELVEGIDRRNPSETPNSTFKYIDIASVDGSLGRIAEYKEMFGSEAPSRARQVIKTNDILVSTVRPYLRATALVPSEFDNEICSTGFCVLRARKGKGYGYLYALSRLPWFTESLNAMARGASYPAVTDSDVLGLHVPYPQDDKYIEQFDVKVKQVIEIQNKRILSVEALEQLFPTLLHRAFTGDLTAKWREAHKKELLVDKEETAMALGPMPINGKTPVIK